ncbi:outer membrane beta-barrel protein [Gaoshiqia sp. Z1-71]|uniref:outer membrane beta-barrel protein n=1 Tax=Gaoshiqia hydrogeniformans TaxID=3290090 RepID=UPI003BF7D4C4
MKRLFLFNLALLLVTFAWAQEQTRTTVTSTKKVLEVTEDADKTEVSLLNDRINIRDNYHSDTTTIRIGKRNIEIIEKDNKTNINVTKDENWDKDWKKNKRFNGHWAGFELGFNGFYNEDYSLYDETGFMDLDQPKSMEVNINFLEYNISLKEERVGLVTGMGFSMNNYRFDNQVTIDKIDGMVMPVPVETEKFDKSKLTLSYLTVPLMLEWQIPVNDHSNHFFISAGMMGGINIGSHTKIKADHSKTKDRGSFNINPFRYAAVARAGLKDISLFASYSLSPLFKDDKGPELFPFTVGISLVNF